MNLFYVEDDKLSRKVMRLMVADTPEFDTLTMFEDSRDFENRVVQLDPKPDVILLDIHVKPLSGFEMLSKLKTMDDFQTIPVVALTASVMNEEVQQLKSAGFDGVVAKPLNPDRFVNAIERIMQGENIWTITQ